MGTTQRWTDEAVLQESARWVHVPAAGVLVEDGERFLVHPNGPGGTSRVWRSCSAREGSEGMILKTIEEVRASGGERLVWHTGDGISSPFMDDLLPRFGFEKTEDLEILAFDLGDGPRPTLPGLDVPDGIRVDLVRDAAGLLEAHRISSSVFRHTAALIEPEIRAYLRGIEGLDCRTPGSTGHGGALRFLAFVGDRTRGGESVIATAGAEIADQTARLWGAGTLAEHRRRGAYRALVVERCRLAHAFGATLALTKANTATSAPLLRKAGFRPVASERRYTLRLPDQHTAGPAD